MRASIIEIINYITKTKDKDVVRRTYNVDSTTDNVL